MANANLPIDNNYQSIQVITLPDAETEASEYIGQLTDEVSSAFTNGALIRVRFEVEDSGIAMSSSVSTSITTYTTAGEGQVEYFYVPKGWFIHVSGTVSITNARGL